MLYDQANSEISNSSVSFKINDIKNEEVLNKLSKTGEINYLLLKKNAPFGYWNISATSEGLETFKQIYVAKNEEAEFVIVNNTILIRNVGNVPYDQLVEMSVGNHTEVKAVNISLGKSLVFELSAPDGEYEVSIDDGNSKASQGGVALTGNAIAISDMRKSGVIGSINKSSIVWVFLIMILGSFLFVASKKMINKRMTLSANKYTEIGTKGAKHKVVTLSSTDGKPKFESTERIASHTMALNGEKQKSGLLALKIKNTDILKHTKSSAYEAINNAVAEITENKGRVYKAGNFIVGIFAPVITKTYENEVRAVKVAKAISERLNGHNAKYAQKIEFGIGVGSGDIIAQKEKDGNLSFTPIGSNLAHVKTIAEIVAT